jgi:hypothetical protein
MGILANSTNTGVMAMFPMSLIPTFLVPISFILHLIGLSSLRTNK